MTVRNKGRKVALVAGLALVVLVAVVVRYRDELVTWYVYRQDFQALGKNEQGYPEYRHRQTGIVFVGLPGGTFDMGSPETEADRGEDEGPVHKVTLSPFLIAKYELTQAQWKAAMGSNPSHTEGDDLPVTRLAWIDCRDFCEKTELSFPTEAQWEYACRAGTTTRFWSGDADEDLDRVGWYEGNSGHRPHSVGEKPPNAFGLHDTHGNVWEWCEDGYDEDFYRKPGATEKNPVCKITSGSEGAVARGGYFSSRGCSSAFRLGGVGRLYGNGFRPAAPYP